MCDRHSSSGISFFKDPCVAQANGDGTSESEANTGAAYVFERSGGSWPQTAKLVADDAARYANFGYSVAVSGDLIVVGAWG